MFFSQNLINQKQKIINHFSFTNLINKIYIQIKEVTKGSDLLKHLWRLIMLFVNTLFTFCTRIEVYFGAGVIAINTTECLIFITRCNLYELIKLPTNTVSSGSTQEHY